jgi:MinD superfamily P-loop ATPase containing an inserted ferredoxin domain
VNIAVLSGKGGAGKTLVSTALFSILPSALYADLDTEEPNGALFFEDYRLLEKHPVFKAIPHFDNKACIRCRRCVDFCAFSALMFIRREVRFFPDICHSCFACRLICPAGAVGEDRVEVGEVATYEKGDKTVLSVTGTIGNRSSEHLTHTVLSSLDRNRINVLDCPPGTGCEVNSILASSDYAVLVAEPTLFGLENLKMVYELIKEKGLSSVAVINKETDEKYKPLESFLHENGIRVALRIKYDEVLSKEIKNGVLSPSLLSLFEPLKKEVVR